MSATNLTFAEIQTRIYQELRTTSASTAYATDYVKSLINEGYFYTFNRLTNYLSEGNAEFKIYPDATLAADVTAADVTITLTDSTKFPAAGTVVIGEDIIAYTGNAANQLTGCTGVDHDNTTDIPVRLTYSITTIASNIDSEQLYPINVEGQPYNYMDSTEFFDEAYSTTYKFTILGARLIFPTNATETLNASFKYSKIPTVLSLDADTPSLIPNNFRIALLMPYVVGNALIADDERTGWDKYFNYNSRDPGRGSGLYFDNLRAFKARYNKAVIPNRKFVGSIYD